MPILRGELVVLRPVEPGDAPALRTIHLAPEVARWWGRMPADFPFDDPDVTRFTVLAGAEVAGLIQFSEEEEPDRRQAAVDVFLDPDWRGRGLGTDALRRLIRHLVEDRRHHRITIDPAADNEVAIRSYRKAGFRPVGVMRSAWRDPHGHWRDVLLMELVVSR